ncbi:MAG: hypothetical protein JWP29_5026 [Rhodoferax sp.]|nr:hypothetical protein [Rhodoferax sp.]
MHSAIFSSVTNDLIASYALTVKNLIQAYQAGAERMVDLVEERVATVLDQMPAPLAADAQRQAKLAQAVVGSVCHRSLAIGTGGAGAVVDKMVALVHQGVQQAAANAARFDETAVVRAFAPLARAAAPAAEAAALLAARVEALSGEWAQTMAGVASAKSAPSVKRASAFAKARAKRAA